MIEANIQGFCSPAFQKQNQEKGLGSDYILNQTNTSCYVKISICTSTHKDRESGKYVNEYIVATLWGQQARDFVATKPRIAELHGKLYTEKGFMQLNASFWKEVKEFDKPKLETQSYQPQNQQLQQEELSMYKKVEFQKEEAILWDE